MSNSLTSLAEQITTPKRTNAPPVHLWHPPLSGNIDIHIAANGEWFHEGEKIHRAALVKLFASILRREEDGEYYLVTPVEKWRISVELHPLIVTDIEQREESDDVVLQAVLNTGREITVNNRYPLLLEPAVGNVALLSLDNGLTALFSRAAWYRLVELAQPHEGVLCVRSAGQYYPLQNAAEVGGNVVP
tara:strand:+ start:49506 stop:50072 length:567 start_codon:yes stop_codon:yes gene_type:complete